MNVVGFYMDKDVNDWLWRRWELVYTHLVTAWCWILGHWI